jgi:hypothetical protein
VFWQHVLMDTQPAPDGSDDAASALSWLFPVTMARPSTCRNRLKETGCSLPCWLSGSERDAGQEAAIRQQIQNVLGHASAAVFQSGRITWKRAKDRVAPDVEPSQDHPPLHRSVQQVHCRFPALCHSD